MGGKVGLSDVYVVMAGVVSDYDDKSGGGPKKVKMYFIAKRKGKSYFDLFTGMKLEEEGNEKKFNLPYVETVTHISEYLKNPNKKRMSKILLYQFCIALNSEQMVRYCGEKK